MNSRERMLAAIRVDERHIMVIYWCVVDSRAGINWSMIELK